MAYDEDLADRIRELVAGEKGLTEQKMFGGLAFLIGGNMAVAASGQGGILVRVDPEQSDKLVSATAAEPMVMRGRSMDGWLRVAAADVHQKRSIVDMGETRRHVRALPSCQEEEVMATTGIRPAYVTWPHYNQRLRETVEAMTEDQLAIQPSPDRWPTWASIGHLACQRVFWLCDFAGEPGAETTRFTNAGYDCPGDDDLEHVLGAADLAGRARLDVPHRRGVPGPMDPRDARRGDQPSRVGRHSWAHTRGWVLQRVFAHDVYHCAELNETLPPRRGSRWSTCGRERPDQRQGRYGRSNRSSVLPIELKSKAAEFACGQKSALRLVVLDVEHGLAVLRRP